MKTRRQLPQRSVFVSAFYMEKYEVTKALWDEVGNWAVAHGYGFEYGAQGKANSHPAHSMTWYDAVKWCNARSEKEKRMPAYYTSASQTTVYRSGLTDVKNDCVKWNTGYRLPTETEWENAARNVTSDRRSPWSDADTTRRSPTNHYVYQPNCDESPRSGFHPTFATADSPYTSPAGYFEANGYGLYDMAGNVWEWCWDWWSDTDRHSSPGDDSRGPVSGLYRVLRGGPWVNLANGVWCAYRNYNYAHNRNNSTGFRCVLAEASST